MVKTKTTIYEREKSPALLLGVFEDENLMALDGNAELSRLCGTVIGSDFKGGLSEISLIYSHGKIAAERVLLVGLGKRERYDGRLMRQAVGTAANFLKERDVSEVGLGFETFLTKDFTPDYTAQSLVEGVLLAVYEFRNYMEEPENKSSFKVLTLLCQSDAMVQDVEKGANCGFVLGHATNTARDLQNHPGNWLTPTRLADEASAMAKEVGLKCKIIEKKEMVDLGMGALLGVAEGSQEPPKFIVLEHNSKRNDELDTIVFVGKAVTFDSGGISIKPSQKMEEMKFDMSGGAAVFGAMKAVAELDIPLHVVGLIPATENLPSATSFKPGDILTASSGTTIEVINTDAEGRLILADALTYAGRYHPKAVIDLATLTGACVVALGHHATGLMGNDQELIDDLRSAGEKAGERAWQLPLWEDYSNDIKGDYADIKNVGSRAGGAITAAAFLWKFSSDYTWAHLDIAGTAWTTDDKPYRKKGGTGVGVRLLVEFLRQGL